MNSVASFLFQSTPYVRDKMTRNRFQPLLDLAYSLD
jgi:hypothetical protein